MSTRRNLILGLVLASLVVGCAEAPRVTEFDFCGPDRPVTCQAGRLHGLAGTAPAGWVVGVQYRKRRFTGCPLASGSCWGAWELGSTWKPYGPALSIPGLTGTWGVAVADDDGKWSISDPASVPSQLIPPVAATDNGAFFEFRLRAYDHESGRIKGDDTMVTGLDGMSIVKQGARALTEARVTGAERVGLLVADGPENQANTQQQTNDDVDLDAFRSQDGEPQPLLVFSSSAIPPPEIDVASPFTSPLSGDGSNPEYPFVLGMVWATRPGHAFLAATVASRPPITDLGIGVRGKIRADVKINVSLCFEWNGVTLVCT